MRRVLVLGTALGAALALGVTGPRAATGECNGFKVCVPVAGPWVVVPAGSTVPRPRVEYQLSCPRGYIVGGLDAELADRAIDVSFAAMLGSPVNPGISTSREAVFAASYAGTPTLRSSFRPHIGCIPGAGGGQRVPTAAATVPPGKPTVRRVWTLRVSPGPPLHAARSCAAGEILVAASHAVGFYTATPPSAALIASVVAVQAVRAGRIMATVWAGRPVGGVRAVVQIDAVCAGGR